MGVLMWKNHTWEAAQIGEQGVIGLFEVPDTMAVAAALNVPLISHQSLLRSLEGDEKLLPAVQSPSINAAWDPTTIQVLKHALTGDKVWSSWLSERRNY